MGRRQTGDDGAPTGDSDRFEDLLAQDRASGRVELFRKRVHLWLPIVTTALLLLLIGLMGGWDFLGSVVITAVTAFFVAGKFIILTGAFETGLPPWELALLVFYMDVFTAILLAYNLDVFYRIPHVGPRLGRLQDYGRYTLREKPYLRRLSFIGVVLFVLFPVAATGAVGGSILGRLVGMRPYRLVLGIMIGSAMGCAALAAFTDAIRDVAEQIRDDPWFRASGIAIIVLLVVFLWHRYHVIERRIASGEIDLGGDGPGP